MGFFYIVETLFKFFSYFVLIGLKKKKQKLKDYDTNVLNYRSKRKCMERFNKKSQKGLKHKTNM